LPAPVKHTKRLDQMDKIKQYWKYAVAALIALILAASGGYVAGWKSHPSKVEQTITRIDDKKINTKLFDKTDTTKTQQTDKKIEKDVVKTKITVQKKDGTVIITETEHEHSGSQSETKKKVDEKKDIVVEKQVVEHTTVETQTITEYFNPTWNVSILALATPIESFNPSSLKYGVMVQHKLPLLPVYGGVMVLTNPTSLSGTQVGISLGFSF